MEKRQRILFYGDTVILAGIRVSLESNPAFEVITLDASLAAAQDLLVPRPDIIIFDMSSVWPRVPGDLILQWAGLVIGIDPANNQVLLWTWQQFCELSMQSLVDIIHQHQARTGIFKGVET